MSRQVLRSVPEIYLKTSLTMKHFFLFCNLESDYWTHRVHIIIFGRPIMVEWGIPEKIIQNVVQMR